MKRFLVPNAPVRYVATNACNQGAGSVSDCDWYYLDWQYDYSLVLPQHINAKETMAVIFSVLRYASQWRNSHVIIFTDNIYTCAAINKGAFRRPVIMQHLRLVFWLRTVFNFTVRAEYIPGSKNFYADAVSRLRQRGHFL